MIGRQIAVRAKPSLEVEQQEDQVVIKTVSGPFVPDEKLSVGRDSFIKQPDGHKLKVDGGGGGGRGV